MEYKKNLNLVEFRDLCAYDKSGWWHYVTNHGVKGIALTKEATESSFKDYINGDLRARMPKYLSEIEELKEFLERGITIIDIQNHIKKLGTKIRDPKSCDRLYPGKDVETFELQLSENWFGNGDIIKTIFAFKQPSGLAYFFGFRYIYDCEVLSDPVNDGLGTWTYSMRVTMERFVWWKFTIKKVKFNG